MPSVVSLSIFSLWGYYSTCTMKYYRYRIKHFYASKSAQLTMSYMRCPWMKKARPSRFRITSKNFASSLLLFTIFSVKCLKIQICSVEWKSSNSYLPIRTRVAHDEKDKGHEAADRSVEKDIWKVKWKKIFFF